MFYETTTAGRTLLHAMPLLVAALCVLAIAYRYYSAFLAAKVAALDDSRPTPAHLYNDGQNYHPTNKWGLFGAGPTHRTGIAHPVRILAGPALVAGRCLRRRRRAGHAGAGRVRAPWW